MWVCPKSGASSAGLFAPPQSRAFEEAAWLAPTRPAASRTLAELPSSAARGEAFRPGREQPTALRTPWQRPRRQGGRGFSGFNEKNVASAPRSHSPAPPFTPQTRRKTQKPAGPSGAAKYTRASPQGPPLPASRPQTKVIWRGRESTRGCQESLEWLREEAYGSAAWDTEITTPRPPQPMQPTGTSPGSGPRTHSAAGMLQVTRGAPGSPEER